MWLWDIICNIWADFTAVLPWGFTSVLSKLASIKQQVLIIKHHDCIAISEQEGPQDWHDV